MPPVIPGQLVVWGNGDRRSDDARDGPAGPPVAFKFPLSVPASQIEGMLNDQQNAPRSDHDGRAQRNDPRDKHGLRTSD